MLEVKEELLRYKTEFSEKIGSLQTGMADCNKRQAVAEYKLIIAHGIASKLAKAVDEAVIALKCLHDERNRINTALNQFKMEAGVTFQEIEKQIAGDKVFDSPITKEMAQRDEGVAREVTDPQITNESTPLFLELMSAKEIAPRISSVPRYSARTPCFWMNGPEAYEKDFPDLLTSANSFQTKAPIKKFNTDIQLVESNYLCLSKIQTPIVSTIVTSRVELKNNEGSRKMSTRGSTKSQQLFTLGHIIGEPFEKRKQSGDRNNKKKESVLRDSIGKPDVSVIVELSRKKKPLFEDTSEPCSSGTSAASQSQEKKDIARDTRKESRAEKNGNEEDTSEQKKVPKSEVVLRTAKPLREKKSFNKTSVPSVQVENDEDARGKSEARKDTKYFIPTKAEREDLLPIAEPISEPDALLQIFTSVSPSALDARYLLENVPSDQFLQPETPSTSDQLNVAKNGETDTSAVWQVGATLDEKEPTITDTSIIVSVSDKMNREGLMVANIATAGNVPEPSPSSDVKETENEVVEVPEAQKKSNRQQKRDKLFARKEERMRAKVEKSDKERLERKANEAAKKAAREVPAGQSTATNNNGEYEDDDEKQEKNRAREMTLAEERKKANMDMLPNSNQFNDLFSFYRRTTISLVPYEVRRRVGEKEEPFDEKIAKGFMRSRISGHKLRGDVDLAAFCDVLEKNMDSTVLDDFRPIYETRRDFAKSLLIERELYADIQSGIFLKTAVHWMTNNDDVRAERYAKDFVKNYIRVQEDIRYRERTPEFGYKTNWLQERLVDGSNGMLLRQSESETANEFFNEMLLFFQSTTTHNLFEPMLIAEIIKTRHPILTADGVVLAQSFYPPEMIYSQYLRLVCRKCTIHEQSPPAAV